MFFASRDAAQKYADTDFMLQTSNLFLTPTISQWYFMLDKEKFIGWLNVAGAFNVLTFDEGIAPDNYTQIPPRGSGVNSIVEKSPKYGGKTTSAGKGTPAPVTLSLGAYLYAIWQSCLQKGALLQANTVKSILDDWTAGTITDATALDRLNAIKFP